MTKANELTTITQVESIDKNEHLASRLLVFITIYVLLNYFILSEIYLFLDAEKDILFTIFLVILSFSYVLGAASLRYSNNFLSRTANILGSLWLGMMVFISVTLIIVEFLAHINVLHQNMKHVVTITTLIILTTYSIINAMRMTKKTIKISNSKIKKSLRLVQISDLHIGASHNQDFLINIIKKVNEENPDITVITGDLIDGKHKYAPNYFDSLNQITSPVYMITGNHERMTGMRRVFELLKNSNVFLLEDKKIKTKDVTIIGIDDTENSSKMIKTLKNMNLNKEDYNILLFHRPKKFNKAISLGVDLMLTGHTHAGQIFPLNLLLKFFYKKVKGLKKQNDSYLYVSPGTGWWGPPMRLGSKNEITIFELEPSKK
ncbi:MAG: metallophosphoesterase [Nanoarchaeota archaeon]